LGVNIDGEIVPFFWHFVRTSGIRRVRQSWLTGAQNKGGAEGNGRRKDVQVVEKYYSTTVRSRSVKKIEKVSVKKLQKAAAGKRFVTCLSRSRRAV